MASMAISKDQETLGFRTASVAVMKDQETMEIGLATMAGEAPLGGSYGGLCHPHTHNEYRMNITIMARTALSRLSTGA